MSKADQNAVKQQTKDQVNQNNANMNATNTQLQSILGTAESNASSLMPAAVSGYSDILSTGGYDPAITGSINTGYSDLAKTGGISPADEAALRSSAALGAQGAYKTAQDQAMRSKTATGGYGDTSGVIAADLARKGSQAASDAEIKADASIVGLKQSGKEAGLSGLSTVQQNQAGNKLAAAGGITNIYGLNESQINSTVDAILRNYQQTGQLNNQDLSILTNLANQPGVFDKIVGTIGTIGGAAAGTLSGLGKIGVHV